MGVATDPSRLTFVAMTYADLPEILRLEEACHPFPWTNTVLADCLRSGYMCWKALSVHDASLVGFAIVMKVVDEHHLLNLVVDRSLQGQGFGTEMMNFLLKQGLEDGAVSMLLEVRVSNTAAQKLYSKMRFEVIGERKGYYAASDGVRETALVMKYRWPKQ